MPVLTICSGRPLRQAEPGKARLVTIRYSHYCDRARWALDLAGLPYTEDSHPPGFAMFHTQGVTDGTISATPVLVLPDGEVVSDSRRIVRRLAEMYPESDVGLLYPHELIDEILELEAELEIDIGAYARQVAYTHLLDQQHLPKSAKWFSRGTCAVERFLYSFTASAIAKAMVGLMRCRYTRIPAAVKVMSACFDRLDARLEGGRQYLVGDGTRFTAADLTFACLAYPLCFPEEYADVMMPFNELPAELAALVRQFRARPAGQHALRMYRLHRFPANRPDRVLVRPNLAREQFDAGPLYGWLAAAIVAVIAVFVGLGWGLLAASGSN